MDVGNTSSLSIPRSSKTDAGTYTIIAANSIGTCTTTVNVKVARPGVSETHKADHVPPGFLVPPASQSTKTGGKVTLSCTYKGKPAPQVVWYLGGKRVDESQTVKVKSTETTSELSISKVDASHAGEYTVSIRNPIGEDLASATVTIAGKETINPFKCWLVLFLS